MVMSLGEVNWKGRSAYQRVPWSWVQQRLLGGSQHHNRFCIEFIRVSKNCFKVMVTQNGMNEGTRFVP